MQFNPALAPLVATIAVCTPSKIAFVFTKFIRFALQVRPNSVHFVVQLSPGIVFTQRTTVCCCAASTEQTTHAATIVITASDINVPLPPRVPLRSAAPPGPRRSATKMNTTSAMKIMPK